jgi:hypothetical protein
MTEAGFCLVLAMATLGLGASSATASAKVCSTAGAGTACTSGHGNVYSGTVAAVSSKVVFTGTSPDNATITCAESTLEMTLNGATGTGSTTRFTLNQCTVPVCALLGGSWGASVTTGWGVTATTEAAAENTNGLLDLTMNGTVFSWSCTSSSGVLWTCQYKGSTPQLGLTGSDTAPQIVVNNVTLSKTIGPETPCGQSLDWSGTYVVKTPSSLFVE